MNLNYLKKNDPKMAKIIKNEILRQNNGLELIASENFVSKTVLEAMGSPLTNKYSEGYPSKRYYGGNEFIDESENLAIERVKKIFKAEHVNVQPHSGTTANMAAYFSILNLGDKILSMDLAHGGHLSHGSKVSFSGKFYNISFYGVNKKTHLIDMDDVYEKALRVKPKLIIAGASAYPRKINFKAFKKIADKVGAYLVADIAHIAGLIAAHLHKSPIPYADIVTTTTHKTLRGPRGAIIMCKNKDHLRPKLKRTLAQRIDSAVFPGMQGGPLNHIIAAKAVAFKEALKPTFIKYQKQVLLNSNILAKTLLENNINLITKGTDNHLILIDLIKTGYSGKDIETELDKIGIFTNKNMIPYDPKTPFNPSGIRIGTAALTTRGFKEKEMKIIGKMIADVILNIKNAKIKQKIKNNVKELVEKYPLY